MPQLEHSSRGEQKVFQGGQKLLKQKRSDEKYISSSFEAFWKKKKTQSTNKILLPVMYGKKTSLRDKFLILLDYFALKGNTECEHDGQFGGGKFLLG